MYTINELREMMKPLSLNELATIRDGFNLVASAMPIMKMQPYRDRAILAQEVINENTEEATSGGRK